MNKYRTKFSKKQNHLKALETLETLLKWKNIEKKIVGCMQCYVLNYFFGKQRRKYPKFAKSKLFKLFDFNNENRNRLHFK